MQNVNAVSMNGMDAWPLLSHMNAVTIVPQQVNWPERSVVSCNHAGQYGGWQQQASMLTAEHRLASGAPATDAAPPASETGAGAGMDTNGHPSPSCSDNQLMMMESGQVQQEAMPQLVGNPPYSCLSQAPSRMLCPSPPALISTAALLPSSPMAQTMGMSICSQQWRNGVDDACAGTASAAHFAKLATLTAASTGWHTQQPATAAVPAACAAGATDAGDCQPAAVPQPMDCSAACPGMPALPARLGVPAADGTSCDTSKDSSGTPSSAAKPAGGALHACEPNTPATPSSERSVCVCTALPEHGFVHGRCGAVTSENYINASTALYCRRRQGSAGRDGGAARAVPDPQAPAQGQGRPPACGQRLFHCNCGVSAVDRLLSPRFWVQWWVLSCWHNGSHAPILQMMRPLCAPPAAGPAAGPKSRPRQGQARAGQPPVSRPLQDEGQVAGHGEQHVPQLTICRSDSGPAEIVPVRHMAPRESHAVLHGGYSTFVGLHVCCVCSRWSRRGWSRRCSSGRAWRMSCSRCRPPSVPLRSTTRICTSISR
jgi:hypothetical protein